MSGSDPFAAQLHGPAEKPVKFQVSVAVDAGIRGQSLFVAGYKFLYYLPVKIFCEIKDIVTDAKTRCNGTGIFHIVQRAAGAFLGAAVIQPHRCADACKAGFFQ